MTSVTVPSTDRMLRGRLRGWIAVLLLTATTCAEAAVLVRYVEDDIMFAFPVALVALYVPLALWAVQRPRPAAAAWMAGALVYVLLVNTSEPPSYEWLWFAAPRAVAAALLVFSAPEAAGTPNLRRQQWVIVGAPVLVGALAILWKVRSPCGCVAPSGSRSLTAWPALPR